MGPKDLDCTLTFKLADDGVKTINELNKEQLEEAKRLIDKALEDYKEPKKHYSIKEFGRVYDLFDPEISCDSTLSDYREIGNYFETEEEAEKAVEKLKAWTRLKDKGFRFTGFSGGSTYIEFTFDKPGELCSAYKDLDLLFSGEDN